MKPSIVDMCRGDGKAYVKVRIEDVTDANRVSMFVRLPDGPRVPCAFYPLQPAGSSEQDDAVQLVAVFPLFEVMQQELVVEQAYQGAVEQAVLQISMGRLKWQSRKNYLFSKDAAHEIRDIDARYDRWGIAVRHVYTIDEGATMVVRIGFQLNRANAQSLTVRAFDAQAHELAQDSIVPMGALECNDMYGEGELVEERLVSVRIPQDTAGVCVAAHDESQALRDGFIYLDKATLENALRITHEETLSADRDPAYADWLAQHQPTASALDGQRALSQYATVDVSAVVYGVSGRTPEADERTLASLHGQTYPVQAIKQIDACGNAITDALQMEVAGDRYVLFVPSGGVLAPHALSEMVHAITQGETPDPLYATMRSINPAATPDIIYCDEDVQQQDGTFGQACFKPDWSPELLQSYPYIGGMVMVRAGAFDLLDTAAQPFADAAVYDLCLRVGQRGGTFEHVSQVLYHAPQGSTFFPSAGDGDQEQVLPYLNALRGHMERSTGSASETTFEHGVFRVFNTLPDQPSVSIVIPNKDQAGLLRDCIDSVLQKATYPHFDIVVVENNSTDPDTFAYYQQAQQADARVKVVEYCARDTHEGFNFSKLVNFGVEQSTGDYVLLLNNDMQVISPDFIEQLISPFALENVGVVGGKLLYRDGAIQHAGVVIGAFGSASHLHYNLPDGNPGYFHRADCIQDLSCVTGACQMISRKAYNQVGGYTPEFAVGYNDVDFCLKVRDAGMRVVYTPYARLYHFEYSSRGKDETLAAKIRGERERSLLRYRWPFYYVQGDLYYNINLDRDSLYFGLNKQND